MAKLPTSLDLGQRPEPQPSRGVAGYSVPDGGGEAAGMAVAQFGEMIGHFADQQQAKQDKVRAEDVTNQLGQKLIDLSVGPDGFMNKRGADAATKPIFKDYVAQFDDAGKQLASTLGNEAQREAFTHRFNAARLDFRHKLLTHVTAENTKYQDKVDVDTVDTEVRRAGVDPQNPMAAETALVRIESAIRSRAQRNGWPEVTVEDELSKARDKVWTSQLDNLRLVDPALALATFQSIPQDKMSPATRLKLGESLFKDAAPVLAQQLNAAGGSVAQSPADDTAVPPAQVKPESNQAAVRRVDNEILAPRGIRNNNPGNLRRGTKPWQGEVAGTDPAYSSFESPEAGIRAMGKTLLAYNDRGINTVQDIISTWAPPNENNTTAYVKTVAKELGVKPDEPLNVRDVKTLTTLTNAIMKVEVTTKGAESIPPAAVQAGLQAALSGGNVVTAKPARAAPGAQQDTAAAVANPAAPKQPVNVLDVALRDPSQPTGNPTIDRLPPDQRIAVLTEARKQANEGMKGVREVLKDRLNDSATAYMVNGTAPNPPSREELVAGYGQYEGMQRWRQLQDVANTGQRILGLKTMPDAQITALLETTKPQPGDGFADRERTYGILVNTANQVRQQRAADPVQYALSTKGYGIKPITDLKDPNALTAEIAARAAAAPRIAADYGTPASLLTKQESSGIAATLKAAPVDQQKQYLGAIFSGVKDIQVYRKTMQALAPDSPVIATAGIDQAMGHRTNDNRDVADLVLRGNAILNPPKREDGMKHEGGSSLVKMPKDDQMKAGFDAEVKDVFIGKENARDLFEQRTRAVYAALSAETGDFSGEVSSKRLKASVALATGGIERYNGNSVIMPYGMALDTFKNGVRDRLALLSPNAIGATADELTRLPLENSGDGRYYVKRGAGYIVTKDGGPLVVDFNYSLPPSPEFTPPQIPNKPRRGVIPKPTSIR